jgi:hypothetical protein
MKSVDDLRRALHYPAAYPPPDTDAIIARARRGRMVQRAVVTGGLTALAVVVTLAATLAPPGPLPGSPPIGSTGGSDPGAPGDQPNAVLVAAVGPAVARAPARFDPVLRTLRVGWIPDGLTNESARVDRYAQRYSGFDETYVTGGARTADNGLSVTILAQGRPKSELPSGALGLPYFFEVRRAAPVNGRPAECLSEEGGPDSCAGLRWQYAPDAWAQVSYAGRAGPTPAQRAAVTRRVAESVSLTTGTPVRLPFTVHHELAGLRVTGTGASVQRPGRVDPVQGTRWTADLDLVDGAGRTISVGVLLVPGDPLSRVERDKDGRIRRNTTVDGHPAALLDSGRHLVVWGVNGTRVMVDLSRRPGNARDLYAGVTVLPDPNDVTGWVPVR